MNTDLDPENELLQLVVEEAVRAGLRTPLREPILAAVEDQSEETVELVEPSGSSEATPADGTDIDSGNEGTGDEPAEAPEKGVVTKAAQGLVVFAVMFTVLYVTLRRLTD